MCNLYTYRSDYWLEPIAGKYMNAKEFFVLVKEMRKAQKYYFKTKSPGSLSYSKGLEKKVDTEIKRVEMVIREKAHPPLFNYFNNLDEGLEP